MDPITLVATALVLGAAAGAKSVGESAIKDAYAGIKRLIQDRYDTVQPAIALLEEDPQEEAYKSAVEKAVTKASAATDKELQKLALHLMRVVEQSKEKVVLAKEANIEIDKILSLAAVTIEDLQAAGSVEVGSIRAGSDVTIRGIRAGSTNDSS